MRYWKTTMDNTTALRQFEQSLRRRSPDRSTATHYLSDVRQFQRFCPKPWLDVTRADIDAFVDDGQAQGWTLRAATLQRRVAALKVFFEFCAAETESLDRPNPVQPRRHAPKRGQRLPRDLSDETLQAVWLVIDHPRDQVWFTLMLRAGLRVGEVVGLKRRDLLSPATATTPARLRVEGKGRKERMVYLSADAYAVLERWLQQSPGGADTPVCPNRRGQPMTVNGLQERLRHYCQLAGVDATCHQLRHTFARQLVEHDLPVTTLSKLMGHDYLSTTQIYLAGADPQVRQAYTDAMDRWEHVLPSLPPVEDPPPAPAVPPLASPPLAAPTPDPEIPPAAPTDWAPSLPAWVREPCLAYVHHQARNWKPSQQRRHSQRLLRALAQFWRWQLTRRPVQAWTELARADLRAFVDDCLARQRSPSLVKNVLYPLWGVLRQRREAGDPIPESVFRLELPKGRELTPRHLTEAEATRLEQHMRAHLVHDTPDARRDAAWYFVLAHTGLRLNELVDLRRADLDLPGTRLHIDQGKGRKDRVVYLSATAVLALERYLAQVPERPAEASLFYRHAMVPMEYRWVQYQLRVLGEAAGVPDVSPHRLRHTFATRLINLGVPVTTIQKLLGHDNLNTTQRYAHVADPTAEREYRHAMQTLEAEAGALSLAPLSLSALLATTAARDCVKQPLDNSL
jgi:site-specific recombinase XerD